MTKKIVLTATVFAALAATSFAGSALILAQGGGSSSLDSALGKVMGIIYKLAYLVAVVGLFTAGYKFMKGETDTGKMAFVGAAIIALGGFIIQSIFSAAGVPINIQIQ